MGERKRERERGRERKRDEEYGSFNFIFKRNDGCLGTFKLYSTIIIVIIELGNARVVVLNPSWIASNEPSIVINFDQDLENSGLYYKRFWIVIL